MFILRKVFSLSEHELANFHSGPKSTRKQDCSKCGSIFMESSLSENLHQEIYGVRALVPEQVCCDLSAYSRRGLKSGQRRKKNTHT